MLQAGTFRCVKQTLDAACMQQTVALHAQYTSSYMGLKDKARRSKPVSADQSKVAKKWLQIPLSTVGLLC